MQQIPLDVLTRPFEAGQIKQREGRGGKMLDYLETHAVITRLNEAFSGAWSFEVLEHKILDAEVLVLGKLTAGGESKQQFGGSGIDRRKDTGEPVSLSDDLKSAASDALKKCATLYGVGLELYQKDAGTVPGKPQDKNGAVSDSQAGFLRNLARSPLLSPTERAQIEAEVQNGLTRERASELIENTKRLVATRRRQQAGRNGAANGAHR